MDSKEIKLVNSKGNLSWIFIGRTDTKAETPILWPPDVKKGSLLPLEMNACLPGCVWNATPRSLSPLERNTGFWTQA